LERPPDFECAVAPVFSIRPHWVSLIDTIAMRRPSRLRSIFRSLSKPANLAGGIVRPHWNSLAHGKPVCTENSDSHVVVMQSAEERMRRDATDPLNRTREWRIFVQRPVRSHIVVIAGIRLQNPTQVRLAQGDHMVGALTSDRSDQSFGKAVLPRRAWSDRFVADAHGSQSMPDGSAVDLIPIADQVARGVASEKSDPCISMM
jgi:hypothetical protein